MLRNKICAFALCAGLGLSLAGCMEKAASDVSDTASRVENGAGETVSRIESGLEEAGSPGGLGRGVRPGPRFLPKRGIQRGVPGRGHPRA